MDYDRKLALTSNVAYSDRDATGRIAGKMELDKAVRKAQQAGLGSQDQVLETLNQLVGSGAMGEGSKGVKNSIDLLPTIAKAATGSGADPSDIAKIVIAGKQNMNMSNDEIKKFLSQSITAGNLGGFELKDMARYLPEQMASYAANGMKGMPGAQDLLAYNQVSRITAGNSDQAGNNLVNLLNKINSQDTARDFAKQGIDLTGSLASARSKGVGTLDAFMALVDKVASKDPQYKSLKSKAAGQNGTDQKQTIDAMMDLYEQKGIGMTVQDRQAMAALLAARQQKGKLNEVRNAVRADNGTQIDTNYNVVRSTSSAAAESLANAKDASASNLLSGGDSVIQRVLNGASSLATAFPNVASASYALVTAFGAVAAMSGVSTLLGGGIEEFEKQEQPRAKRSRLEPYLVQIFRLKSQGYANHQVCKWLSSNGVKVSPEAVRKFVKSRSDEVPKWKQMSKPIHETSTATTTTTATPKEPSQKLPSSKFHYDPKTPVEDVL